MGYDTSFNGCDYYVIGDNADPDNYGYESCIRGREVVTESQYEAIRLVQGHGFSFEDVVRIIKKFKDDDFLTFEQKAFLKSLIKTNCEGNKFAERECMYLCQRLLGMKDSEDEVN